MAVGSILAPRATHRRLTATMDVTYVLPIRCGASHEGHGELFPYMARLAAFAEVILVDNSEPPVFAEHDAGLSPRIRHLPPDADQRTRNGKVGNVVTGIRAAANERVVIADEDVRYEANTLRELAQRLEQADVAVPSNVFEPAPWHARWDTARTLLNRSFWIDYPGTIAVRRSRLLAAGGYDGDVLFENLELLRTVDAGGGRVVTAPEIYVSRRPPPTRGFFTQRVRQAYDDLAQPWKLATMLAIAPATRWALKRRRWSVLAAGIAASLTLAEIGRRRAGGARVYPWTASLWAPVWVAERAVCSWIAVTERLLLGGVRYHEMRFRRAATPLHELRALAGGAARLTGSEPRRGANAQPHVTRRTPVWSWIDRIDRARPRLAAGRAPRRPRRPA